VLKEPLSLPDAEKRARWILEHGTFVVSKHAEQELAKDHLSSVDAVNILRAGACVSFDLVSGSWRYRFGTAKITVVVAFRSETELVVVTAWRMK
jgi:hypothetical protein